MVIVTDQPDPARGTFVGSSIGQRVIAGVFFPSPAQCKGRARSLRANARGRALCLLRCHCRHCQAMGQRRGGGAAAIVHAPDHVRPRPNESRYVPRGPLSHPAALSPSPFQIPPTAGVQTAAATSGYAARCKLPPYRACSLWHPATRWNAAFHSLMPERLWQSPLGLRALFSSAVTAPLFSRARPALCIRAFVDGSRSCGP